MPEAVARGLPSPPEEIAVSIATAIAALKIEGVRVGTVRARGDWKTGDTDRDAPYEGVSVHPLDEQLVNGVIGMQEVAYAMGVTMVFPKDRSATLKGDLIILCKSVIRRRFHNQRLPVGDLTAGVQRHVCVVTQGRPRIPRGGKFEEVDVEQLVILPWVRELPDAGE